MTRSTLVALLRLAALAALPAEASIPRYEPRPGRSRPVIVVLGDNAATETTDYVVPYGILAESQVAEVIALSTEPGPVQMRPALRLRVHVTSDLSGKRLAAPVFYPGSMQRTSAAECGEAKGYVTLELEPTADGSGSVRGWEFHPLPDVPFTPRWLGVRPVA